MELLSKDYFACAIPGCKNPYDSKCDNHGCDNDVCNSHLVKSCNSSHEICVICNGGVSRRSVSMGMSSSSNSSSNSASTKLVLKLVLPKAVNPAVNPAPSKSPPIHSFFQATQKVTALTILWLHKYTCYSYKKDISIWIWYSVYV
jgi:hypothetical protein